MYSDCLDAISLPDCKPAGKLAVSERNEYKSVPWGMNISRGKVNGAGDNSGESGSETAACIGVGSEGDVGAAIEWVESWAETMGELPESALGGYEGETGSLAFKRDFGSGAEKGDVERPNEGECGPACK